MRLYQQLLLKTRMFNFVASWYSLLILCSQPLFAGCSGHKVCCLFAFLWSAIKIKDQTPFIIKFSLNLNYFPILWEAPMFPLTPHRWRCHRLQSCRWRIHRRQCHIPACLFQSLEYSKTKLICKAIIIIRKWWHLFHLKGNVALEPIEKLGAMVTRGQNRGGVAAGHMNVL